MLSQALKDPQLQDVAQRTPLLMLLQRNGFCGAIETYLGPASPPGGFSLSQTAYVARVQINATVTLLDVPVMVTAASEAASEAASRQPLFGYTYQVQERLPAHDGCLRVKGWQACAKACAQAPLCVSWTHHGTVRLCVALCGFVWKCFGVALCGFVWSCFGVASCGFVWSCFGVVLCGIILEWLWNAFWCCFVLLSHAAGTLTFCCTPFFKPHESLKTLNPSTQPPTKILVITGRQFMLRLAGVCPVAHCP